MVRYCRSAAGTPAGSDAGAGRLDGTALSRNPGAGPGFMSLACLRVPRYGCFSKSHDDLVPCTGSSLACVIVLPSADKVHMVMY